MVFATSVSQGGPLLIGVPDAFDLTTTLPSLRFPAAVGGLFGDVPAGRAACLDPIEAPHHE